MLRFGIPESTADHLMLVIRKKQFTAIKEDAGSFYAAFETSMISHIKTVFPDQAEVMTDEEIRVLVREGVEKAAAYRIARSENVALFIDLLVGLAPDFDTREDIAWIRDILEDGQLSEDVRMTLIYRELPGRAG